MGRFLLYLLIVIGAITSVPALRMRAEGPASAAYAHVAPLLKKVSDPVRVALTEREEHVIVAKLKELHDTNTPLPLPISFPDWVHENVTVGTDAWGNDYYLLMRRDSTYVGSMGMDQEQDTDDDILLPLPW